MRPRYHTLLFREDVYFGQWPSMSKKSKCTKLGRNIGKTRSTNISITVVNTISDQNYGIPKPKGWGIGDQMETKNGNEMGTLKPQIQKYKDKLIPGPIAKHNPPPPPPHLPPSHTHTYRHTNNTQPHIHTHAHTHKHP